MYYSCKQFFFVFNWIPCAFGKMYLCFFLKKNRPRYKWNWQIGKTKWHYLGINKMKTSYKPCPINTIVNIPLGTTPRRDNMFSCRKELMISTSLMKSSSASRLALSLRTLMATTSVFPSVFSSPVTREGKEIYHLLPGRL